MQTWKQKTITKRCKYCKAFYEVNLKYARRKIYCSYECGQKYFSYKNGYEKYKEIKALKIVCIIRSCKKYGSSFSEGKSLCQHHFNEVKLQLITI